MAFSTANTGGTLTQAMFIDSNQRVGISCNSPQFALDINNGGAAINGMGPGGQLSLTYTTTTCNTIFHQNGNSFYILIGTGNTSIYNGLRPFVIRNTTGYVGIGADAANYPLDVFGTINLGSPQALNGSTSIRYSNVQNLSAYTTSASLNPNNIPNVIDVGTNAASAYSATPANISPANGTTNPNASITMGHCFNRIRAVGGFLSYTVAQFYTGQTYNVHWYIPWCTYHIAISCVGMTGANSITNYSLQTSVITGVTGAGFCPAEAVMTSYSAAPNFGYYSYGIWQAGNGSSGNQVFMTTITIISPSMAMYNGSFYGVV
jgi:hypothetical protein